MTSEVSSRLLRTFRDLFEIHVNLLKTLIDLFKTFDSFTLIYDLLKIFNRLQQAYLRPCKRLPLVSIWPHCLPRVFTPVIHRHWFKCSYRSIRVNYQSREEKHRNLLLQKNANTNIDWVPHPDNTDTGRKLNFLKILRSNSTNPCFITAPKWIS